MDSDDMGCCLVFILVVCAIAATIAFNVGSGHGKRKLANQIATGTHEVVWSTNEFGTVEVRIVEKEKK